MIKWYAVVKLPAWQQCCMGACKTVSRLLPLRPCFSLAEMSLQLQIIDLRSGVRDGFMGRPKAATLWRQHSGTSPNLRWLFHLSSCFLVLQTSCRPGFGCLSCQKRGVGGFEMEGGGRVATHSRRCVGVGGGQYHGIQRSDHWENRS